MESKKSKKIPAFFKPFIAEDREQRLLIPRFFSEFMKDKMPNSAFIRDRKENLWHVEVSQRENHNFFEAGWSKFVQDKNVQYRDCLVFEYDGESFFDVKIFGDTACEREFCDVVFEAQVKEEEMEEEYSENYEVEEGDDEEMEDEDTDQDDDGHGNTDQDEIVELRDANKRKRNIEKNKSCSGGMGNNAKNTKELADDIIFDLGIVDRPKNPYFVAKLDPKRKSDLRVPTDVIRDFNLKLPERMNICDEDGRTWSVVVKEWNDGRTCLTKGWRAFWKWNALKPNDKCLCEFVPAGNNGSEIQLKIRIFRATSLLQ